MLNFFEAHFTDVILQESCRHLAAGTDGLLLLQVFGPAFKRNSRWSLTQPVPDVGDEETPYHVVDKFYDFWFAFKSWREFPHDDEEDIEQAESREEKR